MTGRVFEASGQFLAVAEGWVRGPVDRPDRRPDPARRRRRQAARRRPPQLGHGRPPRDRGPSRSGERGGEGGANVPLNPDAVDAETEPVEVRWTSKDALLYAVGIGAGHEELAFTTENTERRAAAGVPDVPGRHRLGQGLADGRASGRSTRRCWSTASRPSRSTGRSRSRARRRSSAHRRDVRQGEGGGRRHRDRRPRWTVSRCTPTAMSVFIRGEGGWGGERGPSGPQNVPPERTPDHEVTYQTVAGPGVRLPPVR